MENIKPAAMDVLDRFERPEVLDENERLRGFHIFWDLRNHFHEELTALENMNLFYHYRSYEKCLARFRARDLHSGEFYFTEAQRLDRELPLSVRPGMESLFNAMVAYREYVYGRYDEAVDTLRYAIRCAEIQGETFPIFLCEIAEQWLNIVRVFVRRHDQSGIQRESSLILSFLAGGVYYDPQITARYLALDRNTHSQALIHVIDSIYNAIVRMTKDNQEHIRSIYKGILEQLVPNLHANPVSEPVGIAFRILSEDLQDQPETFLQELSVHFDKIRLVPRTLQRMLWQGFLRLSDKYDIALEDHPNYALFVSLMNRHYKIDLNSKSIRNEIPAFSTVGAQ